MWPHIWIVFLFFTAVLSSATQLLLFLWRDRNDYYSALSAVLSCFLVLGIAILYRNYLLINLDPVPVIPLYVSYAITTLTNFAMLAALILFLHRFHGLKPVRLERAFMAIIALAALFFASPFGVSLDVASAQMHFHLGYQVGNAVYTLAFCYGLFVSVRYFGHLVAPNDRIFERVFIAWLFLGFIEHIANFVLKFPASSAPLTGGAEGIEFAVIFYALFCGYLLFRLLRQSPLLAEEELAEQTDSQQEIWRSQFQLTKREAEVAEWVLEGLSNQQIADKGHVSLATIKTHLHNIYSKVEVKSRFELARKLTQP